MLTGKDESSGETRRERSSHAVTKETTRSKRNNYSAEALRNKAIRIANQCYSHYIPFKRDRSVFESVNTYFNAQTDDNYNNLISVLCGASNNA